MPKIALFRTKSFQLLFMAALIVGVGVSFAVDSDNDGISDLYEAVFKLDQGANDAALDPDADALSNLAEFALWTDPSAPDTDLDGWTDAEDNDPLSRAVMMLGHPDFTDGDDYAYTGPAWWLGASKIDGSWTADGWGVASNDVPAALLVEVDRSILTNNCVMDLWMDDPSGSDVRVHLLDASGADLATDLAGDLTSGTATKVYKRVAIPFADHPTASVVAVEVAQADAGFALRVATLYIDQDGDGLDAAQEAQLGTDDNVADTDEDGLSDFNEAMVSGTEPALADTDADGVVDGLEIERGTDPSALDSDGDGLSNAEEEALGTDPNSGDSDGDGLTDIEESSGIIFISTNLFWTAAKADAELRGGRLAVVSDAAKHQAAVSTRFGRVVRWDEAGWIGATDRNEEGVWKWLDGTPVDFNRWADNAPDNLVVNEDFAHYRTERMVWNDKIEYADFSYLLEYEGGLDPLNPDTDGDGVSDGDEVDAGMDPRFADSDNDGLSNADEAALGTDPLNADTDGDGLSDLAELEGLFLVSTNISWSAAKAAAEGRGGRLAVIDSAEKHAKVVVVTGGAALCEENAWIGATDREQEGVWKWVTGESLEYARWRLGSPNNDRGEEHYAHYSASELRWNDTVNHQQFSYLLEYDGGLDPVSADTDGDGFADGVELAAGTDPLVADSDGDGLSNSEEAALGTDPFAVDTDSDGIPDGVEAGSAFFLVGVSNTWDNAKAEAEFRGGHLASIGSAEELRELLREAAPAHYAWIGMREVETEGAWSWVTGEPFGYSNWLDGNPNNFGGLLHCGLVKSDGGWGDHRNVFFFPYVLEYDTGLSPLDPDADGDGLLDGQEVAMGLNPLAADTDGDGIADGDELAAGLNPALTDSDSDGLADAAELNQLSSDASNWDSDNDGLPDGDELNVTGTDMMAADTDADGTADLVEIARVNGVDTHDRFDAHFTKVWSDAGTGVRLSAATTHGYDSFVAYNINVATAGMYQIAVRVEWDDGVPELKRRSKFQFHVDGHEVGTVVAYDDGVTDGVALVYSPWMNRGGHVVRVTSVMKDTQLAPGFVIKDVRLMAVDGVDADANGRDDWIDDRLAAASDTDGDGINDLDEITLHGTDPLDADTDGDGLADGAELDAGTDPLDADSDDDGVVDGVEVNESLTNPLVAEFDGTVTVVETVSGSATNAVVGEWEIEGSELVSKRVRGSVEYVMNFPTNDLYRLNINAAHHWNKSSCSPVLPKDTSAFLVFVDDVYVGKFPMVSAEGNAVDVGAFLPVMPAGEHRVKIYWENVHKRLSLRVNELTLQSLGGPDNNGNGTKDWIEASISAMAGVDSLELEVGSSEFNVLKSFYSPYCLEGDARYVEFMTLVDDASSFVPVAKSAGPCWYANVPLEQEGVTTATATFQNGALSVPVEIEWTALNLMEHDGETIHVRKDDMLKFVALPADAHGGQFELEFILDVDGETMRSPNTRPLIYIFPEAGEYTVSGEYRKGNQTVEASITVVAFDGAFPAESPACLVGQQREWTFEGMPSNVVYEVDESVELSILGVSPSTNNHHSTTVALLANDCNGTHNVVARLYPGGPVLDATRLSPFWIQNAVDGYFWTVERYEDSELWEVESIAKDLPETVNVQIKVIISGVTLDDYSLERWIGAGDYDEVGEYKFRLFHPNDSSASTCHTVNLYQDGIAVGEALFGGNIDITDD